MSSETTFFSASNGLAWKATARSVNSVKTDRMRMFIPFLILRTRNVVRFRGAEHGMPVGGIEELRTLAPIRAHLHEHFEKNLTTKERLHLMARKRRDLLE